MNSCSEFFLPEYFTNKQAPVSCKAQLASKCLFMPTFFSRRFWPTK